MTKSVRPEVQYFSRAMEKKLKANDHKQHWSKCSEGYLSMRLSEEVDELNKAMLELNVLRKYRSRKLGVSPLDSLIKKAKERARLECADVANFAMMIYDNLKD